MAGELVTAENGVVDWLDSVSDFVGSIPDGVLGAVIGVVAAQIVGSVSTYRRRRDEYRAPQRAAIGAVLAASNELKVAITAAIDYSGMSGRQTSDDLVIEVANDFFRRLFGLDEAFEIAFLTVVDGPCYDQLVAAEKPFQTLRKIANNPLFARTDTAQGFAEFMLRLGTASDNLDADLGYLIELAQKRLRPSRRLLSRKPTAVRTRKVKPSVESGNRPSPSALQSAVLLSQSGSSTRQRITPSDRSISDDEPPEGTERLHGTDLNRSYLGRLVARTEDGVVVRGQIVELIPNLSSSERDWVVQVIWEHRPRQPPEPFMVRARDSIDVVVT